MSGNCQTAVHGRPAFAVLQQPEIDMIEREGQRHAQPEHAGRHLPYRSAGRRILKRERHGGGKVVFERESGFRHVWILVAWAAGLPRWRLDST